MVYQANIVYIISCSIIINLQINTDVQENRVKLVMTLWKINCIKKIIIDNMLKTFKVHITLKKF